MTLRSKRNEVTDHSTDLRVGDRLDEDPVACPVVAEPADHLRCDTPTEKAEDQDQRQPS